MLIRGADPVTDHRSVNANFSEGPKKSQCTHGRVSHQQTMQKKGAVIQLEMLQSLEN